MNHRRKWNGETIRNGLFYIFLSIKNSFEGLLAYIVYNYISYYILSKNRRNISNDVIRFKIELNNVLYLRLDFLRKKTSSFWIIIDVSIKRLTLERIIQQINLVSDRLSQSIYSIEISELSKDRYLHFFIRQQLYIYIQCYIIKITI